MEYPNQRLVNHVHLQAANFAACQRFYAALLTALDRPAPSLSDDRLESDELLITAGAPDKQVQLAFRCDSPASLQRCQIAALDNGGRPVPTSPTAPEPSLTVRDPDGNEVLLFCPPGVKAAFGKPSGDTPFTVSE